jgi:hypothetical protein
MPTLKFIIQVSKPYKWYLFGMMLAMLGVALYGNLHSYLIKLLIDAIALPSQHFLISLVIAHCLPTLLHMDRSL